MKKFHLASMFILLVGSFANANPQPVSPEDVQHVLPPPTSTPPPSLTPSPEPSPTKTPPPSITPQIFTSPSPSPSSSPTPTPTIDPCAGVTIEQLAGRISSQTHDGKTYRFNPSAMTYDSRRGIYYQNDIDATWTCQKSSIAQNLKVPVNIVSEWGSHARSDGGAGDIGSRLNTASYVFSVNFPVRACFSCGLVRHKKGCFPPGTKVAFEDGKETKAVEEIKVGDYLWNPILKKNSKVLSVVEGPEENALIIISASDQTMRLSQEHPVVTRAGIKLAKNISLGDVLVDGDGKDQLIEKIELAPKEQAQTVLNFVMERTGDEHDGLILVEGFVVGDLTIQKSLSLDEVSKRE